MDVASEAPGAPDALVEAARGLAGAARARALEAERARRLPVETVDGLKRSGLARVLQPARCGGMELGLPAHHEVVEEVARGCGSTAWCLAVFHVDSWIVGLLGRDAQDEIYGAGPDTLVAGALDRRGVAARRRGGYELAGRWPFASGSERADWVVLGARAADGGGDALFAVPAAELAFHDDWHAAGLRATGSCSVEAAGVVVPERRALSVRDAGLGRAPGAGLHAGPLYRAPLAPCVAAGLVAPALGVAAGAVADFAGRVSGRAEGHLRDAPDIESPVVHQAVAGAAAGVDTARALLRRAAADIHGAALRGGRMTRGARARVRMDCAYAVALCREGVDGLFHACGGEGLAEGHPVQRAWRDLHAMGQHAMLRLGTAAGIHGRALLGVDPGTDVL